MSDQLDAQDVEDLLTILYRVRDDRRALRSIGPDRLETLRAKLRMLDFEIASRPDSHAIDPMWNQVGTPRRQSPYGA